MSSGATLPRPRLAQATLLLASMLTIMAGATISPALPAIQRAFGSGPNTAVLVGLVLTMHGLFIAVGSPLIGAFADRYGRRWLLLVSTTVAGGYYSFRQSSTRSRGARGSCSIRSWQFSLAGLCWDWPLRA